jgi:hypothetical protein
MPWNLNGNAGTNPPSEFVGTNDNTALVVKTNGKEVLHIDPSGNVGLGTSSPSCKFEIAAQDGLQITGFQPFLTLKDSNSGGARARIQNADGDINLFTEASFGSGIPPLKIANSTGTVQIAGQDALQIVGFQPFLTLADSSSGFPKARIQNANGDINFFTEASLASGKPPMKIVNATGNIEVSSDVILTGADCAEDFDISTAQAVEPGTVMVIDQDGSLRPSANAYDRKVAGVISGGGDCRPGIILDKRQSGSGRMPIALVGKVYCKVDAQYSPIDVGDLLTTSPTPGHAMKADDPLKAFGSVIGKALRALDEGQDSIPILIALQ